MPGTFHLHKSADGQFRFTLEAGNGLALLLSEPFPAKSAALAGVAAVRLGVARETAFEPLTGEDGHPYFLLRSFDGALLGHSQRFASAVGCRLGMDSVRRHAPDAELLDETPRP